MLKRQKAAAAKKAPETKESARESSMMTGMPGTSKDRDTSNPRGGDPTSLDASVLDGDGKGLKSDDDLTAS